MNWKEEYESLVRSIGSLTYGKERWFYQDDNTWYDRQDGKHIDQYELYKRVMQAIEEETLWTELNFLKKEEKE